MVTVVQLHPQNSAAALGPLAEGLAAAEQALLGRALEFAEPMYAGQVLSTGEPTWSHALGLAANLASIGLDAPGRAAGVLFAAPKHLGGVDALRERFGEEIAGLAAGVEKLYQLRVATRANPHEQNEVLRKMVLGMVEDVRVVLIRLASRTQTLRWFAKNDSQEKIPYSRETLDIYSPLANRLGVWQLKWELEDLSFRYLEPEVYKRIAQMLDERRVERQQYIARTIATLARELEEVGVKAEITGRPKHIYSIWNKMRSKSLDFSEVYDVRAARIIVPSVKDCYTALGVVHNLWQPIPKEFDDYISRPKGNLYQSLHTAVVGPAGRTLEVQIRTEEMHRQAEFGVAAHWRYKEPGKPSRREGAFEQKIAWLRELLAWRDEIADWGKSAKTIDDSVYVLTPQGKVIDLPAGSTPLDFAYALHSDFGHRCRGARVDGRSVTLDTPLGFGKPDDLFAAVARDEINLRQLQTALRGAEPEPLRKEEVARKTRGKTSGAGVLIVGMDRLLTQLARCCKPVPPDPIRGFVTRGKGVSVHREDCPSLKRLAERQPERLIETDWGKGEGSYALDMAVTAADRRGLLRDICDALARERINVTAVRTQSRDELAFMRFTFDVANLGQLKRAFAVVRSLKGVIRVGRG